MEFFYRMETIDTFDVMKVLGLDVIKLITNFNFTKQRSYYEHVYDAGLKTIYKYIFATNSFKVLI